MEDRWLMGEPAEIIRAPLPARASQGEGVLFWGGFPRVAPSSQPGAIVFHPFRILVRVSLRRLLRWIKRRWCRGAGSPLDQQILPHLEHGLDVFGRGVGF